MEVSTKNVALVNSTEGLSAQNYELLSNGSEEDFALNIFGPVRDALYVVVPITVIYASIFLTGIIGNVSTCIVIARNKSMHTATNYYLFSLAISDLLLLVSGLPPEIYLVWSKYPYIFGESFCVLRGLAAETSTNATVLTITAFTIERYVAICHPFLSHTMSKLSRAIKLILIIWLVALSFAIPQALQFGIVKHRIETTEIMLCTLKTVIVQHSFELSTFLFFLVPMTLITVLYALIGLKLRKSNMMKRDSGTSCSRSRKNTPFVRKDRNCRHHTGRSSRRVLKMLVAVVVAFFICWAPFHVQRLIAIWGTSTVDHVSSNSPWMEFLYLLFTYVSGVLYYVSTTINPILYNIMSNKFREAFMETLGRCCRIGAFKGRRGQRRSYSTLSRSQQRANGIFACRNGGMGGHQESTDCSGNSQSIREDSVQQSVSGGGCGRIGGSPIEEGGGGIVSKNPSNESSHQRVTSYGGKRSSSRRTLSTEIGSSTDMKYSETCSSNRSVHGYHYRGGRWSTNRGSFASNNGHQKQNDDELIAVRYPRTPDSPVSLEAVKVKGTAIIYRPNGKARFTSRWWNLLKWLSNRRKPLATNRRMTSSPSGPIENMIIDVQVNPEEYSMTACDISNTSLRDVDRRAMDEELSAYMEEIRNREIQNEMRVSENG